MTISNQVIILCNRSIRFIFKDEVCYAKTHHKLDCTKEYENIFTTSFSTFIRQNSTGWLSDAIGSYSYLHLLW